VSYAGARVETKMFVSYFCENLFSLFCEKNLQTVTKIAKIFSKTSAKIVVKTKISAKTDVGNGNFMKHKKSKEQKKLRS
jgi:hypothetical protein